VARVTMTTVYTDIKEGTTMKQRYAAPSLKVLGSLGDLTLITVKGRSEVPDGFEFEGIILTSS
jgi:hypothetical protein